MEEQYIDILRRWRTAFIDRVQMKVESDEDKDFLLKLTTDTNAAIVNYEDRVEV